MSQKKLKPHLHLQQTTEADKYELSIYLDLDGQYQLEGGWPDKVGQKYMVNLVRSETGYTHVEAVLDDTNEGDDSTVTVELWDVTPLPLGTNLLGSCTVYYAKADPARN